MANVEFVFLFSGKRKSGKDYVADLLQKKLSKTRCGILRLAAPLKKQYALDNNLNYEMLLDSSAYKEKFRAAMIKWSEGICDKDPFHFCRLATSCSVQQRGFQFVAGIDDEMSECALDDYQKWDLIICNNGDDVALNSQIEEMIKAVPPSAKH